MICACAAAADSNSKGYGFLTVWSFLLTLALSGGGTLVVRRVEYRTPLAVGFLIGVTFMMANLMLITATISGSNLGRWGLGTLPSSTEATQAFSIMLFMAYTSFCIFITQWRDVLLPPPMSGQESSGLPPSQSAFGGSSYDNNYGGGNVEEGYGGDNTNGGAAPL